MAADYSRPEPVDDETLKRLQKPERKRYVKNRDRAKKKLTRAQVREAVYRRERMVCERCGIRTRKPTECYWAGDPHMAHVNEMVPRSLGGDPLDPDNCELVCQACHLPNGQHAPTPERMRTLKAKG